MLTPEAKKEKRNWFFFIVGYFTGGYCLINWLNQFRTQYYDVSFAFEKDIPFIPAFIFGYILVYFSMLLLYLILDDIGDFRRAVVACLSLTTVHYIFFLLIPVKFMLRPDLTAVTGFGVDVTKFYYIIDMPYNCFPSLHVAYPTMAALVSWRHHRYASGMFIVMTIVIAVSVVFVKQHYIMDVVAGAMTSTVVYCIVLATEKKWKGLFRPSSASPASLQCRSL